MLEHMLEYMKTFFNTSYLEYHLLDTYRCKWLTKLVIDNYSDCNLESIRYLEHLEILRLDNCDLELVNMKNWNFSLLDIRITGKDDFKNL